MEPNPDVWVGIQVVANQGGQEGSLSPTEHRRKVSWVSSLAGNLCGEGRDIGGAWDATRGRAGPRRDVFANMNFYSQSKEALEDPHTPQSSLICFSLSLLTANPGTYICIHPASGCFIQDIAGGPIGYGTSGTADPFWALGIFPWRRNKREGWGKMEIRD